ncbi:putative Prefoldin subunit [Trypanosoma vivax]|uniref:Putative prefoldin subunit 2 n=1 Tax=Trypanosoma vivax (strain Y486) TaxID=1055687 RepID=G0U8F5_TRYVY|nr:putative prefoldin subunit 2 [Trypanosoma vivax]KAH8604894.1 putative Prefoldin subunit [Trypanosoma vivax]CCC53879.1 putative prefoldin subunit 2 [Trypanosoma vivax Y486]
MASKRSESDSQAEEEVVQRYQQLRQECQAMFSRMTELENELHEHELVAETLSQLNGDRRCHRLVGGALIERTVADTLPELEGNIKGIKEALEQLKKMLENKQAAMEEYARKHGVAVAKQHGQDTNANASQETKVSPSTGSKGVLV